MRQFLLLTPMLWLPLCVHGQLGELPADPVMTEFVTGVEAEIPIVLFIEPARLRSMIPEGFRLRLVTDRGLEQMGYPESAAGMAILNLLVIAAETIVVDEARIEPSGGSVAAISSLWAFIEEPAVTYDTRVRGPQAAVELSSWYPDSAVVSRLVSANLAAEYADVSATLDGDTWRFDIRFQTGEISGSCVFHDDSFDLGVPPGYQTVWQTGTTPSAFKVYAYYGHQGRRCDVEVEATGDHWMATLVRSAIGSGNLSTVVQHSWTAHGGYYRR